jgi:sulfatase maturation enzyme AslB (radical SAM superfamily)
MGAVLCERPFAFDRGPRPFVGTGESGGKLMRCLVDLGGPCNMSCVVCPRQGPQVSITEAFAGAIGHQVLWRARAAGATRILAGFHGGEPLLNPELIQALSTHIRQEARFAGMGYEGACITNGSLLDETLARGLRSSGISAIQVTLEGPQPRHDEMRRLLTGEPTFARILDGLRRAQERVRLLVRVETLGLETEEIDDLLTSLDAAGLLGAPGVSVYWAPPSPYEEQLRDLWDVLAAPPIPAA